eukprot:scpid110149/ scgid18105/ 
MGFSRGTPYPNCCSSSASYDYRSALNGHNIITAINTWAVALIWYSAGMLAWTQDELKSTDRRTRKLMTMHGALHPRADVARMYVSCKEGGRGFQSIHDVVTM